MEDQGFIESLATDPHSDDIIVTGISTEADREDQQIPQVKETDVAKEAPAVVPTDQKSDVPNSTDDETSTEVIYDDRTPTNMVTSHIPTADQIVENTLPRVEDSMVIDEKDMITEPITQLVTNVEDFVQNLVDEPIIEVVTEVGLNIVAKATDEIGAGIEILENPTILCC